MLTSYIAIGGYCHLLLLLNQMRQLKPADEIYNDRSSAQFLIWHSFFSMIHELIANGLTVAAGCCFWYCYCNLIVSFWIGKFSIIWMNFNLSIGGRENVVHQQNYKFIFLSLSSFPTTAIVATIEPSKHSKSTNQRLHSISRLNRIPPICKY